MYQARRIFRFASQHSLIEQPGHAALAHLILIALRACAPSGDLESCRRIHRDAVKTGLYSNLFVANSAVNAFAKCRAMAESYTVFDRMPRHSTVSWNSLIMGYVENGDFERAFGSFQRMLREGCEANARTYLAALMACTAKISKNEEHRSYILEKGMEIHARAKITGSLSDTFVGNALVNLYAKCGSMVDARLVFDTMPWHDMVSWNSLIVGYGANGDNNLALEIFTHVRTSRGCCEANARTFVAALMACFGLAESEEHREIDGVLVKLESLEKCMEIHADATRSGFESQTCLASILVDLYAESGSVMDSRCVFDRMPCHDVVSWTSLILGHVKNSESELALELFEFLRDSSACLPNSRTFIAALSACATMAAKQGKELDPGSDLAKLSCLDRGMAIHSQAACCAGFDLSSDLFLASAVVEMYAKCGSMLDAQRAFDRMVNHDVVAWTSLILGYAENGHGKLALDLFQQMQRRGCAPNPQTFVATLVACSNTAALDSGKNIHAQICRYKLEHHQFVANSLVDFYAKCGAMAEAEMIFASLEPESRNSVTWGAILAGYARQGDTDRALELFGTMRDEATQGWWSNAAGSSGRCESATASPRRSSTTTAWWTRWGGPISWTRRWPWLGACRSSPTQ
ncbi:pentatricopeptide repeat-containing protein At2g13600-like isoform X2 [Selaginella moellendorffii]|uniref:pentatricopeptide repeat-containing protein At2g13600-like isoform X2 n=1 Tax=Selaginella moellendorffii TaxID=88036 RepID=UPI000D1C2BF3|nr:pentatricopeptide repeat-containing protein At2g13600-like isoform X2 [Selaginella moellendorffii]|eukprot:XP_024535720.1 pentatricopeptide repeat-containing protein At2g13600-like isoform X2 [Selaginella moellendorffii]